MTTLLYALTALVGYLLGSIPVALLVARRHGVSLHETGDGNPGAWNALEQLGAARAWPAFVGDALKGFLAGLVGWLLVGDWPAAYVGVAAAMIGHALPVFARFLGGKAVMTFVGGAVAVSPVAVLGCLAVCAALSLTRGGFALGARAGVFVFPIFQLAFDPVERVAATGGLMCVIGALFALRR